MGTSWISHHVAMIKLWVGILILGSITGGGRADETVALIQHEIAMEQVARVEKYLEQNPDAPDALAGINLLLQGYQVLRRPEQILATLMKRYEIYRANPEGNEAALLSKTIFPALQAMYQRNQRSRAADFAAKVLADFEGHAFLNNIKVGIAVIEERFRQPEIGDRPSFEFTEFYTGVKYSLDELKGRYVLIEFWVNGCDVCEEERPYIKEVYERYRDQGLEVFGFSRSKKEDDMIASVEKYGMSWPQCLDTLPEHGVAQKLKLIGVPFNMLLDREGVVEAVNLRGSQLLEHVERIFVEAEPQVAERSE